MILIGTDNGIYRWFEGTPWPIFHSLQGRAVVALASQGGGTLVAADGAGRFWESGNNGLTWRDIPLPAWAGGGLALALGGAPAEVVLATRSSGLYRKALGAESWTPLANPTNSTQGPAPLVRSLVPGPGEAPPWYAAVAGEGLWRSADGGATWEPCPGLPPEVYSIRAPAQPEGTVLVGTSDGCWISPDAGRTWERRGGGDLAKAPHVGVVEARPDDPKYLLAGASPSPPEGETAAPVDGLGFALYESRDGGQTWARVRRGFPEDLDHDPIADIRFNPSAPDSAIVALASGELWNTRNGGDWFEPLARQLQAARVLCAV